jgi:hypothetical protein
MRACARPADGTVSVRCNKILDTSVVALLGAAALAALAMLAAIGLPRRALSRAAAVPSRSR